MRRRAGLTCALAGAIAGILCISAGPAAGAAGDAFYNGLIKGDAAAKVNFSVVKNRGIQNVIRLQFENVLEYCDGQPPHRIYYSEGIFDKATVRNDGTWKTGSHGVKATGEFTGRKAKKAKGTFKFDALVYQGPQATEPVHCTTGELKWSAERR